MRFAHALTSIQRSGIVADDVGLKSSVNLFRNKLEIPNIMEVDTKYEHFHIFVDCSMTAIIEMHSSSMAHLLHCPLFCEHRFSIV